VNSLDSAKGLIETIEVKTQAARLRAIMPEILRRLDEGVSHEQIVEALNQSGHFDLSLGTFRKYLYRYRQKLRRRTDTSSNFSGEKMHYQIDELQSNETKSASEKLEDIISARNRETLGDNYINRSRPIFGKSRSQKT